MNIRMPLARLAMVALAAMLVLPLVAADAMAAREKFDRKKPHVNVGTIGDVDQDGPDALASPDGAATPSPDPNPDNNNCLPDPSKPADTQAC